jgi:mono/diheme cytochrome c family protein
MLPRSQPVIRFLIAMLSLGLLGDGPSLSSDEPAPQMISAESRELFRNQVQPLLVKACGNCHGKEPVDNELDLTSFGSAQAIIARPNVLSVIAERVGRGDMPPKEAPQPTPAEREQLLGWIKAALDAEAAARAGDPGPVTLRRLTNTEYDNAIRDLTGVDLRPTQAREFPTDSVGGEGFANVGEAMPVTPELIERYHLAARDVAARVVLLPQGFRFSTSPDRPAWADEALKSLRSFHARHAGPNGEPPLAAHLAATLRYRDRLTRDGSAAIAAVAAEEKLNARYLAALWAGLNGQSGSAVVEALTRQWREKAAEIETERQRRQTALQAARQAIESRWAASKRLLAESKVAEAGSVPFESKISVKRGEVLLLTVLPNENHGADSTLVEWTIRETTGDQRTWSVADLVSNLLKGNSWQDQQEARWSFLETTSTPAFLTERRDSNGGRPELKSWSIGSEPSVFVNSAAEPVPVWTTLPARSFFVHPGPKRPVAVAWTSPIDGELFVSGRVADAHPAGLDGVSFELAHVAAHDQGPALAEMSRASTPLPDAGLPPDMLALVRAKWREAGTDPAPVLAAIKAMQDQLFQGLYRKNAVLAVGNGFPAWEDLHRVSAREQVQSAAREPLFRMIALPAQPDTYVVWDRLRLEGGDGPPLVLAENPALRAAVEQASGLKFGQHPLGRPVPRSALVTAAGAEVVIDLKALPAGLQQALTLPRFLRADVSLDEASPETASVQAFLIAATGGGGTHAEPVATATPGDPRAALIVHPRVAAERARPAAEFRALFPPAVLFEPIIPRDAQGSVFMYHREDEPLRRLLLDDAGRTELDRLWSELQFTSEQALATPRMYEEIVQYYRKPNDGARIMFFYIQLYAERVTREEQALLAAQVAAEPGHLEALLAFAARAWRRPLAANEREAILASYRADRAEGAKHDPAFRAALTRVLSSPWFLYRVERPATGPRWQPVSGDELATRLSFLLWDSIPDDELRSQATTLHEPAVMEEQLRRMLKDVRVRGMAGEFGARWLGVRDFATNHGRSEKHFPEFTSDLRDALAEEPVRFFEDLFINDRPVADVIAADAVVVNELLAKHYGIPGVTGAEWRRLENVSAYSRGGLLGFGAVIARQSAAARTSPVKRGAWVVEILGERLPKPPPGVPPLPETPPPGLSVREITERHRSDQACASCHVRIDPFGMALEGFDALGRLRPASELKPGDTQATTRDGTVIDGFSGLRDYMAGPRREDLLRALAHKLTGYALGRSVQLSDRKLVDEVARTMASGGRWSDALLVIVRSEQFRCIRPVMSPPTTAP